MILTVTTKFYGKDKVLLEHPEVTVRGGDLALVKIGNPKDIDELKRNADWAKYIIDYYESHIKIHYVLREKQ